MVKPAVAFALGGLTFLGASYVLHCKYGMGPWPCQSNDCRHKGNRLPNGDELEFDPDAVDYLDPGV
jgi:hypothetical protein